MLSMTAMNIKRPWRTHALVALATVVFGVVLVVSSAISRGTPSSTPFAPATDVRPASTSATDRQIGVLQDRLRQEPAVPKSAARLGLAYLQRARETSDPSL